MRISSLLLVAMLAISLVEDAAAQGKSIGRRQRTITRTVVAPMNPVAADSVAGIRAVCGVIASSKTRQAAQHYPVLEVSMRSGGEYSFLGGPGIALVDGHRYLFRFAEPKWNSIPVLLTAVSVQNCDAYAARK